MYRYTRRRFQTSNFLEPQFCSSPTQYNLLGGGIPRIDEVKVDVLRRCSKLRLNLDLEHWWGALLCGASRKKENTILQRRCFEI
jgi:hypothetical protein